jgi:hypothetical protein
LRWYSSDYLQGNTSSRQKSTIITTSPHFEIKKRSGDLISKHLLPTLAVFNGLKSNIPVSIHPLFKMAPDSFTKNFTYESEQKQELYLQKIKQYQPVIFNAYTRHYFLSANKKVRITIDTDVRFYEIYHKIINWRRYYQLQALVLEIKSSLSDANEIIDTAKYFPYSLSKCSKYVLGVMCCFPKIEAPLYQVLAQPRFDNHIV